MESPAEKVILLEIQLENINEALKDKSQEELVSFSQLASLIEEFRRLMATHIDITDGTDNTKRHVLDFIWRKSYAQFIDHLGQNVILSGEFAGPPHDSTRVQKSRQHVLEYLRSLYTAVKDAHAGHVKLGDHFDTSASSFKFALDMLEQVLQLEEENRKLRRQVESQPKGPDIQQIKEERIDLANTNSRLRKENSKLRQQRNQMESKAAKSECQADPPLVQPSSIESSVAGRQQEQDDVDDSSSQADDTSFRIDIPSDDDEKYLEDPSDSEDINYISDDDMGSPSESSAGPLERFIDLLQVREPEKEREYIRPLHVYDPVKVENTYTRAYPRATLASVLGRNPQVTCPTIAKPKPLASKYNIKKLVCPRQDQNPDIPRLPGESGSMNFGFGPADYDIFSSTPLRYPFFGGVVKRPGENRKVRYIYMGEYECTRVSLWNSCETWQKRPPTTQKDYIIFARDKNPQNKNPDLEKIRQDFELGQVVLPCVELKFLRYDHAFAKELEGCCTGLEARNKKTGQSRLRNSEDDDSEAEQKRKRLRNESWTS